MTALLLQIKVEVKETKEQCEGLKNDLRSVSANLEATLTKKEEEPQILFQVKEQAAAADNDTIDGGASPSPSGEDGKPAPSPLNKTSQQQPPSPSSSSNPTPTASKPYCMYIKFNDDYGFESLATY